MYSSMPNDQRPQHELSRSINQLEGNGFSSEHLDPSSCDSQRGNMQHHGHLGCGRMPVSLLIASAALGIVVSGASGTISAKSQMIPATSSAGEISKDRFAVLASMYRSALHEHGVCGRYGSRLAVRGGRHSGFHTSAQRVARGIRGGTSSASSASDRYAARMQVMITRNMRKVLVEELDYLPEEVDDMDPQIAAVVIEKSLPRPRTGMPIVWRKSIRRKGSSSSSPLAAMGSLLRTTVNRALGVLALPLRALGRVRDAGFKGVAVALVVLGALAIAGTMVGSPEHKGFLSGFAPHALVTGIGEKVKAKVPKRRRSIGGERRGNPSRTNAKRGREGRGGSGGREGAKSRSGSGQKTEARSDKPAVPKLRSPSAEARLGSSSSRVAPKVAAATRPTGGSEGPALSSERDGERASIASTGRSSRGQGRAAAAAAAAAGAGGRNRNGENVDSVPPAKHASDSRGRGSSGSGGDGTGATGGANRPTPEIRRDADTGATEKTDGVDDFRSDVSAQTMYGMEITPEDIPEEVADADADVDGDRSPEGRPRWESRPMAEHIPSEDELETWEKQMVEPKDTWLDKRIDSALDTVFGGKK